MRTPSANKNTLTREWVLFDAADAVVGRMATKIATILRGKHKPNFTPHVDVGDFVVVINAEKVRFSGSKEVNKKYWSHSGFPGGEKSVSPKRQREIFPERIVMHAVKGMLPKGPLGRQMLKKLKVYAGQEHPHQAQAPKLLSL